MFNVNGKLLLLFLFLLILILLTFPLQFKVDFKATLFARGKDAKERAPLCAIDLFRHRGPSVCLSAQRCSIVEEIAAVGLHRDVERAADSPDAELERDLDLRVVRRFVWRQWWQASVEGLIARCKSFADRQVKVRDVHRADRVEQPRQARIARLIVEIDSDVMQIVAGKCWRRRQRRTHVC